MCVCVYECVCVCICVCVFECVCGWVCGCVCGCVWACGCVHVRKRERTCVWALVHIDIWHMYKRSPCLSTLQHTHLRIALSEVPLRSTLAPSHYSTLQQIATRCNTLQHAATRCNSLQHTHLPIAFTDMPLRSTHCNRL